MKKLLAAVSLMAMSFSSFAKDITENDLQSYIQALPAVVDWSQDQDALKSVNLGSMLGGSDSSTGGMALSALGMIKDNDLYKDFAALTNQYGFTPEQLLTVGTEVSMAYFENLKGSLSPENKEKVNQLMGGLQSLNGSKDKSASAMVGTLGNSASAATTDAPAVSENNLELVQEYMPQLQKLFAMVQ
ncbi:short-chain dehydrogenase [Pseudoalteromonas shioyasakiensis]|uniref:short-chain dehydrogenase n=1 Tax=Pseudoalteromonas shioyasakiensis TaxID=1190813 RepID=UPI0021198F38|nr:short-chain dehydrogenase [Pseudoalteromonas shioyasakiensis]MCQ8878825.1 short-chain dehydrogenase [Pseudoalteromonas shioyasakiensis]